MIDKKQTTKTVTQYGIKIDSKIKAGGWHEDLMNWINGSSSTPDQNAAASSTIPNDVAAAPVAS